MTIVVVSPHRDDAAFSLALGIEQWLAAGHKIRLLNCFTQSDYAPFSDIDTLHANDRVSFATAIRKREDIAWNKLLRNRLQITDLDLLDAPLRLVCSVDEVQTQEIRAGDRAVARIAGSLAKLHRNNPTFAFVLPLAIGAHIDHRVVRQAGLEALSSTDAPFAFYEDLPYAARPGADEQIPSLAESTGLALTPTVILAPQAEPEAQITSKRRIAECYDSQVDSDTVNAIAEFSKRYNGGERVWANAAWQASHLNETTPEPPA